MIQKYKLISLSLLLLVSIAIIFFFFAKPHQIPSGFAPPRKHGEIYTTERCIGFDFIYLDLRPSDGPALAICFGQIIEIVRVSN